RWYVSYLNALTGLLARRGLVLGLVAIVLLLGSGGCQSLLGDFTVSAGSAGSSSGGAGSTGNAGSAGSAGTSGDGPDCVPGFAVCPGTSGCVDLQNSAADCGKCGQACGAGQSC